VLTLASIPGLVISRKLGLRAKLMAASDGNPLRIQRGPIAEGQAVRLGEIGGLLGAVAYFALEFGNPHTFGGMDGGQLNGSSLLVIDNDAQLVQTWSEVVTHAVQADARSIDALRQIGADFSIAVVAVGSSIESSVLITANLVDLGIPQIWAKAISKSHGTILERIGANHVIYPEAQAGERVAHLVSGRMLDFIEFDDDFAIVKLYPPKPIRGMTLAQSAVRKKYGITVVGVKTAGQDFTYATPETLVGDHDLIIVSGNSSDIERFANLQK
jgi:trk system potassium uptake protein TrkA